MDDFSLFLGHHVLCDDEDDVFQVVETVATVAATLALLSYEEKSLRHAETRCYLV
jgi:hypothetical protein